MSKKGIINDDGMMQHGSMVINEGQIESSTGSLVGQEHLAQIFQRLLQSGCAEEVLTTGERFKTVTIAFPQHYYTISRRGAKIYVARLAHNSASAEMFVNSASNTVASNSQAAEQAPHHQTTDADPEQPKQEKDHDSDNESVSSTSSSIATVKSEQRNSDDEDDEPHASRVEQSGPALRADSPLQPPTSIESSIQQQRDTDGH
jgi:hypothetical protein